MQMFTAMAIYLVISALNVYRSAKRFLGDLWRWFALTFLFVSSETSFHHWCNGEQDWSEMTGDWGDWDSWQGTIPWWAAANILAVWTVYSKKKYKKIYALQILIAIGSFVGFQAWKLKGKDVPKWMIGTVTAFFAPWIIIGLAIGAKDLFLFAFGEKEKEKRRQYRENVLKSRIERAQLALNSKQKPINDIGHGIQQSKEAYKKIWKNTRVASFEVQMAIALACIIIASAAPKMRENDVLNRTQSDGYRDISTIVMMTSCAIVGLCWGISSIATKRHTDKVAQNLNYSRLQLCVRVQ